MGQVQMVYCLRFSPQIEYLPSIGAKISDSTCKSASIGGYYWLTDLQLKALMIQQLIAIENHE